MAGRTGDADPRDHRAAALDPGFADRASRPARAANVGAAPYLSAMRRGLILAGLVLVVLGIAWPWLERIGLGHLPGDIRLRRPGFTLFVPLGSSLLVSIVLSVALTAILWLLRR